MSGIPNITDFAATDTIATFIVPTTGTYYLSAEGAEGGSDRGATNGGAGGFAGRGLLPHARSNAAGVAVGEEGSYGSYNDEGPMPLSGPTDGGGGGASLIVLAGSMDVPLLVAGGGGGGTYYTGTGGVSPAGDGQGSSGAGYLSDGAGTVLVVGFADGRSSTSSEGQDFADGLGGGAGITYDTNYPQEVQSSDGGGGFGGGGGAEYSGPGGGGGYTGGDDGDGGTSYVSPDATDPVLIAGVEIGNGAASLAYPACFTQGTLIATPDGSAAVQTLRVGDLVLSARRHRAVPVRWVGSRRVVCARMLDSTWGHPVRIAAGAFGPGQPIRDLFLSPDHAVFAAGVLIPVRMLLNGRNVGRYPVPAVTYWHVQVDEHDILLAEGLPVESFLDTGKLSEPGAATRVWEAAGCAPLQVTGPEVAAVRVQLACALAG